MWPFPEATSAVARVARAVLREGILLLGRMLLESRYSWMAWDDVKLG